jgi:hypothetical protein
MRKHFIGHLLLNWHKSGKDLISRKSGCGAAGDAPNRWPPTLRWCLFRQ